MTIDWNVDTPIPTRPPASPPRRWRPSRRRGRGPARLGTVLGAALVLALMLASCDLLGGLGREEDHATSRAVRPVTPRAAVHPIPIRWGVDRMADPTALLVDGTDAFVVESYAVSSIGVASGVTRWRVNVKDAEPFVVANADTVLVSAVDGFEALDRATGASRWRVTVDDPYDRGRMVGMVRTEHGPIAILTTEHGGVAGVDATSGATRWSAAVDGSPRGEVVTDDRSGLVVLEADHGARVELHVLDAATGAERWSTGLGVMTGLPVVDESRLVLDTGGIDTAGTVVAFDLASGVRRWTASIPGSSEVGEGAIVDGRRLVVLDGLGSVTALERGTGRRIWSTELPMPAFHGRPIVLDDALVVRDIAGTFRVLDRRTGRLQGSFRTTGTGVGLGAGPAGLVFARARVTRHQVVGLPRAMLTMRTVGRSPERSVGITARRHRFG